MRLLALESWHQGPDPEFAHKFKPRAANPKREPEAKTTGP